MSGEALYRLVLRLSAEVASSIYLSPVFEAYRGVLQFELDTSSADAFVGVLNSAGSLPKDLVCLLLRKLWQSLELAIAQIKFSKS